MMMLRANQDEEITAGNFMPVNLSTLVSVSFNYFISYYYELFFQIYKTTLSFFTCLRKVPGKR